MEENTLALDNAVDNTKKRGGRTSYELRDSSLYDSNGRKVANFHLLIVAQRIRLDDERQVGRELLLIININGRSVPLVITIDDFTGKRLMKRVYSKVGSEAVLYGSVKQLRIAAQVMSPSDLPTTYISISHGFTQDGSRYISPGLEIAAEGIFTGSDVDTDTGTFARFIKMIPPSPDLILPLARHLLEDFLELKSHAITYPLTGHLALAPFASLIPSVTGRQRVGLHLQGISGGGKTFLASMLLRFFGDFGDRFLSWTSTANSIEAEGYFLKDVIVVLDDLKLATTNHKDLVRVFQNHSNGQGRSRLTPDARIGGGPYIRGLLLSTGEDFIEGVPSVRGRTITLEIEPEQNQRAGRQCLAQAHLYPMFLPGLIHMVISRTTWKEDFRQAVNRLSDALQREIPALPNGPRICANWALNAVGFTWFVDYLQRLGALDQRRQKEMLDEYRQIVLAHIQRHAAMLVEENPVEIFFGVLTQKFATGTVSIDGLFESKNGSGKRIGKLSQDGGSVYVLPHSVMELLNSYFRATGMKPPFSKEALKTGLVQAGLLERSPDRITTQVRFGASRVQAWVFSAEDFRARCGMEANE